MNEPAEARTIAHPGRRAGRADVPSSRPARLRLVALVTAVVLVSSALAQKALAQASGAAADSASGNDQVDPESDPTVREDPSTEPPHTSPRPTSPAEAEPADAEPAEGGDADSEDELPEAHRPELSLHVDTGENGVRTGDIVRVTLTAVVPEGDDIAVPTQEFGALELHAHDYADELTEDGRRRFTFEFDLLALEPGEHEIPGIRLRVVTPDGEVGEVRTDPNVIEVGSHIANEPNAQPRPPTAPVSVMQEDYTLAWVLGGLAALLLMALVGFFAGRWWMRRPRAPAPPPPPRPPWEVALEQLESLKRDREAMLAEGEHVEFVDRVSDIVRHYLGQRYDFNGLESTSDEVVGRLARVKLRGVSREAIRALLADSDLVKFARAVPDDAQCDRMLEGAFHVVRSTTPRPNELIPTADTPAPTEPDPATRLTAPDGSVTLHLTVRSIAEAETAIGAAVGAAVRDKANDASFDGIIRVVLSPELPASEEVDRALSAVFDQLADELDRAETGRLGGIRLVFEHHHAPPHEGASRREATQVTIIDDDGLRVESRQWASAGTGTGTGAVARTGTEAGAGTEAEAGAGTEAEAGAGSGPAGGAPIDSRSRTLVGVALTPREGRDRAETRTEMTAAPDVRGTTASTVDRAERPGEHEPTPRTPDADQARSSRGVVVDTAFPEAAERVRPQFYVQRESNEREPLLRWVAGLERPVAYGLEEADGMRLLSAEALRGVGLTRAKIHERALDHVRGDLPEGFRPTEQPAVLDGGAAALLALPELVPEGESWIALPTGDGALIVLREGADSTEDELRRLARELGAEPLFHRPVRVRRRGFEPARWPEAPGARATRPGFSLPDDHPSATAGHQGGEEDNDDPEGGAP